MKVTKRPASITLVVLILMVVSSFLVLITMRYFLHMLSTFGSLTNYYRAYYLARGNMDILLTQQDYRGYGYEVPLFSGSGEDFASCNSGVCEITSSIVSRFPRIDNSDKPTTYMCSRDTAIWVAPSQRAIFELFADEGDKDNFSFKKVGDIRESKDYGSLGSTIKNIHMYVFLTGGQTLASSIGQVQLVDIAAGERGEVVKTLPIQQGTDFSSADPRVDQYAYVAKNIFGSLDNLGKNTVVIENNKDNTQALGICFSYSDQALSDADLASDNIPMIGRKSLIHTDVRVADAYVTLDTIKTKFFPGTFLQ